ncbi:M16 family metallopeptidase [Roseateles toxinivorans]|uniref:Zinc protease n=1 Tax=Roseateles toxinivorans TaxID=270368 RepID=A0A4R6QGE5_9BURK|nr:pitrilysin family protein [Roseateles toxinivorans]TDP60609.1 zinc protease [Roseateles toxinivorans]
MMKMKLMAPATVLALSLMLQPASAQTKPRRPAATVVKPVAVPAPPAQAIVAPVPPEVETPTAVRELGGIEEYRLANGLQILLFPDEAQSTTTVNITYRVGSRHEAPGEYGMAHLLEHLVFKGTPSHADIPGAFAQRGMRWNGTTTVDRTNYFASFNASDDTLAFALALEADRMVNSHIAKADLDKEMSVVRNEFERGENNPFQVLNQRVRSVAYDWHPYAHATIGPRSDIENVPIEKLQAFYKRHYRPDNATLLVAGRFDKAQTLALVAKTFGPLPRPPQANPQPYTVEPAQDGERSVVVRRIGGQPLLLAHYHVPAIAHGDSAALLVYGLMMSLQPSGQLYKELVESKLAVATGLSGLGGMDPGSAMAYAVLTQEADVAKVEARLLDLIEGRAARPFTEAELARVRELALVSYRQQMKNPEALIQQISSLIGSGDWRLLFQLMEDIPRVTLADVERVRQAYFRPANRTLGRYLPATTAERVEIPAAPSLDQRLAELKGPPKVEEGERFDPTPAHLEARMQRRVLPSGITLHTLRKQTRGNTVQLRMQLRWGGRDATYARRGTDLIGPLLSEGSRGYAKQQLQDTLIKLNAHLQISSGDQGATLVLTAETSSLLPALKIAADLMQQPLLPAAALERVQRAAVAGLQASRSEPETLRAEAVRTHYNTARGVTSGHPDYIRSLEERRLAIEAARLDDLRGFHADYWSANEAAVAVVGALPEGLDTAIEQLFGTWKKPAAPRYVRHEPSFRAIPPARFDAQAPDKANAVLRFQAPLKLSQRDADYAAMAVAVHVFGGGALESRLASRVRQQEGLSYGISAALGAPYFGDEAALTISASYAPANRERVITLVQEELQRMGEQAISATELQRAKTDILEGRKQSRASEAQLAGGLLTLIERGETWAQAQSRDEELLALSADEVLAAWRRLIKPDGFVISTAGDFKTQP